MSALRRRAHSIRSGTLDARLVDMLGLQYPLGRGRIRLVAFARRTERDHIISSGLSGGNRVAVSSTLRTPPNGVNSSQVLQVVKVPW